MAFKPHPLLPELSQPSQIARADAVGAERVVRAAAALHDLHEAWTTTLAGPTWRLCYSCQARALVAVEAADAEREGDR